MTTEAAKRLSAAADHAPLIGVCAVHERARWSVWDQPAHLVADSYVGAIQRAGGIAMLFPIDLGASARLTAVVDGLLLIGGADIDPAMYGAEPAPGIEVTYPARDAFEVGVLREALDKGIPVLGICRGMQMLNVALGGTLVQDLAAPNGHNPHRRVLGSFEGTEHDVVLEPGSLVARAAVEQTHTARCHHHQAVAELGSGLAVTGRAEDGVIEAIETAGDGWVLGVQWHPEAEARSAIMDAFVAAATAGRAHARAASTSALR